MTFTSSTDELCTSVQSLEDSIVEDPMPTTLQLEIGVVNDRISVDPSNMLIAIQDDDSMFMNSLS